jgi:PAS domain S-box-containing protein
MIWELGNGQWDIPALRQLLVDVLPHDDRFDDFEIEHEFERIGRRIMILNGRRLDHQQLILLSIEDQTERRRAERELRDSEARLRALMEHAPVGIGLADQEGRWVLQNAKLAGWSTGVVPSRDPDQRARWRPLDPEVEADRPDTWPTARALRGESVAPQLEFLVDLEGGQRCLGVSAAPVPVEDDGLHTVVIVEDMTGRKRAAEEREVLLGELNHRVKNIFAVIRALAVQTDRGRTSEEFQKVFLGRLDALVAAHELVLERRWQTVELGTLVRRTLAPFATGLPEAVEIEGDTVELDARRALSFSLALHELATNAAKYGALSAHEGRILVVWSVSAQPDGDGRRVRIVWEEQGGPPAVRPERRGFGTRMIEGAFAYELSGEATLDFRPEGLRLEAWFPLS